MANPIPLKMTASAATRLIRQKAEASDNVVITVHAQERMEERGITLDDVLAILRRGAVYLPPFRNEVKDWQAEMERRMPGGRDAVAVTVVPAAPRMIVRTVMWRDER